MKILFLTEQFPFPLHDGGNLRTFHVLAGLVREHEVTLISHRPANASQVLGKFPINCEIVTVEKPRIASRVMNGIHQAGRSLFIAKNWSSPLLAAAEEALKEEHFDAIHFNHLDTACYSLVRDWQPVKVFDTHNCLSAMAEQVSGNADRWWRKKFFTHESQQLRDAESKICWRMDRILVCSDVDAENFQQFCPDAEFEVVPNGVETEFFKANKQVEQEPRSLVFTGAMNYFPNEQATQYFCNDVFPHIKTKDVKVSFVGRRPTAQVQSLHDGNQVIVTGEVDDVRPYVDRSEIFIVPLRHGSGTRLKILEAFAMGKAVVSTSIGAEGIPVTNGRELILADSPQAFAESIDRLLAESTMRIEMGLRARQFVKRHFDWTSIQAKVCETYSQLRSPVCVG